MKKILLGLTLVCGFVSFAQANKTVDTVKQTVKETVKNVDPKKVTATFFSTIKNIPTMFLEKKNLVVKSYEKVAPKFVKTSVNCALNHPKMMLTVVAASAALVHFRKPIFNRGRIACTNVKKLFVAKEVEKTDAKVNTPNSTTANPKK